MIFFDEGKKSLPNGGNVNLFIGIVYWKQPCNLEKFSLMVK